MSYMSRAATFKMQRMRKQNRELDRPSSKWQHPILLALDALSSTLICLWNLIHKKNIAQL